MLADKLRRLWDDFGFQELYEDYINPPKRSAEAEEELQKELDEQSVKLCTAVALIAAFGLIGFLFTDYLVYNDLIFELYLIWRIIFSLGAIVTVLIVNFSTIGEKYPDKFFFGWILLPAFQVNYLGGWYLEAKLTEPWFYWSYILPFITPFMVNSKIFERTVMTISLPLAAYIGGF